MKNLLWSMLWNYCHSIWLPPFPSSFIFHLRIADSANGAQRMLFIYIFHFRWQLNCKLTRKLQKCKMNAERATLPRLGWPNSRCLARTRHGMKAWSLRRISLWEFPRIGIGIWIRAAVKLFVICICALAVPAVAARRLSSLGPWGGATLSSVWRFKHHPNTSEYFQYWYAILIAKVEGGQAKAFHTF